MRTPIASEPDWLQATHPRNMIRFLGKRISDRKGNLLAVACFRRVWHLLKTERGWRAVEVFEQYVEGQATAEQLAVAKEDAWQSCVEIPNPQGNKLPEHLALGAIGLHDDPEGMIRGAAEATAWVKVGTPEAISKPEERAQCSLVREIFGNPFRSVNVNPAWLTSTALALASGIYEERAFDRMPILADALQDAGCDNDDILSHCRQPSEHVRGCWVVDLILGKS